MNYYSSDAFILFKSTTREEDSIYHAFTKEFGHINFYTKGSRHILSKLAGHLEPPSLVSINFIQGRSPRLVTALEKNPYLVVKQSLPALNITLRMGKLVDFFTPIALPDLNVWQLISDSLFLIEQNLEKFPEIVDFVWFYFNARLLTLEGVAPFLDGCAVCGSKVQANFFSFSHRGLVCKIHRSPGDIPLTPLQKKVLYLLFYAPLSSFSRKSVIQYILREKKFLDKFLEQFTALAKSDIL